MGKETHQYVAKTVAEAKALLARLEQEEKEAALAAIADTKNDYQKSKEKSEELLARIRLVEPGFEKLPELPPKEEYQQLSKRLPDLLEKIRIDEPYFENGPGLAKAIKLVVVAGKPAMKFDAIAKAIGQGVTYDMVAKSIGANLKTKEPDYDGTELTGVVRLAEEKE
jgi:hypothetical protein